MPEPIESNHRIVIDPHRLGWFGGSSVSDRLIEPDHRKRGQQMRKRCEDMIEQIKRHVDYVASVDIECDVEEATDA